MVYTMWDSTPLKWHKFLTFFVLPLGAVLNICQAILLVSEPDNWVGILIPLNAIDLARFAGCTMLGVVAISGCLPSRRKWYGPMCAIILYAVLAAYSIYNIVAAYLLNVADSKFVTQSIANLISFSATSGLTYIYYRKRRALFSPLRQSVSKIPVKPAEISQHPEQKSGDEPENSLELLAKIQAEAEKERTENKPSKKKKSAPVWVTIFLGACCIILLVAGIWIWYRMNQEIKNAIADRDNWEERYHTVTRQVDNLADLMSERDKERLFWKDYAVIVTETGEKYHTYGCQYIQGREFWIYNIDAAIDMGYEPCSECSPPGTVSYSLNRLLEDARESDSYTD